MGPTLISAQAQAFLFLKQRADLAAWLGVTDRQLRYILYSLPESSKYDSFTIKKRNGGSRNIDAPLGFLKHAQAKIHSAIQEISRPSGIAKGFVPGRSIFDHVRLHRSKRWVLVADIEGFFAAINFGRVRGAFLARPFCFPEVIATCLAQLCCKGNALPQGAPTSPSISNLICRRLDHVLVSLAKTHKCDVSRYADDICISTNLKAIPLAVATTLPDGTFMAGPALIAALNSNGFALNTKKFHVWHRRDRQMVTGLIVNKGVAASRSWKRQLRVLLNILRKHGDVRGVEIIASWSRPATRNRVVLSLENLVTGKAGFAGWIDKRSGSNFIESLHRNYPTLKRTLPRIEARVSLRLMTEGDTDAIHLESALDRLKASGEFTELDPKFKNYDGDKGDTDLWETVMRIAKIDVDELTIAIFDCDNLPFMKSKTLDVGGVLRVGRMVYVMCLGRPSTVPAGPFCIESLYPRAQSSKFTGDDRRLFFGDEFDSVTGIDSAGEFKRQYPKKPAIVLSDKVERISDKKSVLLSKTEFAKMVSAQAAPFTNIDIDGFRPTLKILREILARHT